MNPALAKRLRLLASAISLLVLLFLAAGGWVYSRVRASLPPLEGTLPLAGLAARVTIERDALGVPTIRGENRADVARALGFLHAQDRFFQMDVFRRSAAGELSEIFGTKTLPHDRKVRIHGFRRIAEQTLAQLPPAHRAIVDAYAEGVNAGLGALASKPFEYLVARADPAPWKPEDTFLVSSAMLLDLQDASAQYEQALMTVRDEYGLPGLAFFAPLLTPGDAALDGTEGTPPPILPPTTLDLRAAAAATVPTPPAARAGTPEQPALAFLQRHPDATPGSNAFALAGHRTAGGAALVAGDMHLNLRVPNVWYRASIEYGGRKITGVTLAGTPLIVAGSNGRVAWSFTNAYVDTADLVAIDTNGIARTLYRTGTGQELISFEKRVETILVQGHPPAKVDYEWSVWGPVIARDSKDRPLALKWTGHDPAATNLELIAMEDAATVDEACSVAHRSGIPAQNLIVADADGHIAWTIAGKLPRRVGYDGRLPVTFQFGDRSWDGYVPADQIPVVTTKPRGATHELAADHGTIWSANQRMMGGEAIAILGDGGYARPARAAQIREALGKLQGAGPEDLLAVQLDDRALFLERWYQLLLQTLTPEAIAEKELRGSMRQYVEKWEGRASVEAVSYPIVREFRQAVYSRVLQPLFARAFSARQSFSPGQLRMEPAVWALLEQRPMHLLDPQYASWDALLLAAADDVINELDRRGVKVEYATWGQLNRADIRHPFSYGLATFLSSWLDMPSDPLPGDVDMPRVQTPGHGASERFVVAPGREREGIFHMPGGQSGHPLSPFYRAGHDAWVKGEPTPFLPGAIVHTLVLEPR